MLHGTQQWVPLLVSEKSLPLPLSGLLAAGIGKPLRASDLLPGVMEMGIPAAVIGQVRGRTSPAISQCPLVPRAELGPVHCVTGLRAASQRLSPAPGDPSKHTASLELVSRGRHHGLVWFNSGHLV